MRSRHDGLRSILLTKSRTKIACTASACERVAYISRYQSMSALLRHLTDHTPRTMDTAQPANPVSNENRYRQISAGWSCARYSHTMLLELLPASRTTVTPSQLRSSTPSKPLGSSWSTTSSAVSMLKTRRRRASSSRMYSRPASSMWMSPTYMYRLFSRACTAARADARGCAPCAEAPESPGRMIWPGWRAQPRRSVAGSRPSSR